MDEVETTIDILAVAATRPAMVHGVPQTLLFCNVMIAVLGALWGGVLFGAYANQALIMLGGGSSVFLVLHGVSLILSRRDPQFLALYWRSFQLTPPVMNRRFWGKVNSYAP